MKEKDLEYFMFHGDRPRVARSDTKDDYWREIQRLNALVANLRRVMLSNAIAGILVNSGHGTTSKHLRDLADQLERKPDIEE